MNYVLAAAALLGISASIHADAQNKPGDVVHYRQDIMGVIGWNFAPMGAMVKKKTAWDAAAFAKRAERLEFLSTQVLEGFPNASTGGVETDAKADIWNDFDDFKSKLNDLVAEAKNLNEAAKSGDETKMKDQFKKTADACKACHEKYKAN
ncbi:MAG TPA: cytochrome c [Rudaea sp.]|jgi:cytochrome c556|nr:cytochrome c [Rudaea sp.]